MFCWSTATPFTDVLLAVDDRKRLADEEMKVVFDSNGQLQRITKLVDWAEVDNHDDLDRARRIAKGY